MTRSAQWASGQICWGKNDKYKHKIFRDNYLGVTVLKIKQNITFKLTLFVKNLTKYFKLTLIVISTPNK